MKKVFFLAGALMVASCKKDKPVAPGGSTNAKLLKKLTKTEDGVTTVYNMLYDGSKRLVSLKSTDNQTGIVFTYDASGNLVGAEDIEDDFKNVYTYAYTNNLPVSGTFKSWQKTAGEPAALIEDDLLSYTVTNKQVSKIHIRFTQTGDASDFELSYGANGNLSKAVTTGTEGYTASFTYGNRKPVFPIVSEYTLDQAGFILQFTAKNELLSLSYDFPGTQYDQSITTQYTYDAAGYIITAADGTTHTKFDYE